jgi:diacylglycerol kinase family enzyme
MTHEINGYGPVVLIVNPASTRARKGLAGEAERVLSDRGLVEVMMTRARGDGVDLARRAAQQGAAVVVTVGGDGTVNEVAAGLAGSSVALAPLPAGSTNVFTRGLGWPARGTAALAAVSWQLAHGAPTREIVLGRIQAGDIDRPFSMNAGAGVDAEAVNIVENNPWLKHRLRHLGFALAIAAAERRLARGQGLDVRVDGAAPFHVGAAVAACGAPFAYLGPRAMDLVPGATHDGGLAWLAIERVRAVTVVRAVAGAVRSGRHVTHAGILHGTGAREIVLTSDYPFAVQVDGEALGRHREAILSTGPRIRVLSPRTPEGVAPSG